MKIFAPNTQYTGISAGVTFVNGIGETTNPKLISWFEEKGYRVEKDPPADPPVEVSKVEIPPVEIVSRETITEDPPGEKPKTRSKRGSE